MLAIRDADRVASWREHDGRTKETAGERGPRRDWEVGRTSTLLASGARMTTTPSSGALAADAITLLVVDAYLLIQRFAIPLLVEPEISTRILQGGQTQVELLGLNFSFLTVTFLAPFVLGVLLFGFWRLQPVPRWRTGMSIVTAMAAISVPLHVSLLAAAWSDNDTPGPGTWSRP